MLGLWLVPGRVEAADVSLGSVVVAPTEVEGDEARAAKTAHEAGLEAYEHGDFVVAAEQFERAYELGGALADLYGWAQAARSAGDCRTAIELYERFIARGVEGDTRRAAEGNVARCREQLEAEPPRPTVPPDRGEEVAEPEPEPPLPGTPPRPRRRPDPLGVSLVVIGGASVVAGAVVLGVGAAQRAVQDEVTGYGRFDTLDGGIDRLHIAGGVTLGVGVALALAGVVRLVVMHRRARPEGAGLARVRSP